MPRTPALRRPGRPSRQSRDQRQALLHAARDAFGEHGLEAVSLRRIAERAEVAPSLAHYYFGNLAGLRKAVFDECVAPALTTLADAVRNRREEPTAALTAFMQQCAALAARHVWLPRLAMEYQPVTSLALALVREGQTRGTIRRDVPASSIALSVLALCLFPYAARDSVSETLGVDCSPAGAAALTLHHVALLRSGVQSPRQDSRS
jgi:TetR/AcrR family transcriptional regulator